MKIEPGNKFGNWTIISFDKIDNNYSKRWLCRCKCGEEHSVQQSGLKSGGSTQCRQCYYKRMFIDISGQDFGVWHVIKRAYINKNKSWLWECSCNQCGTIKNITLDRLKKNPKKCRKCNHYKKMKGGTWVHIQYGAKFRNLEFNLTQKEAYSIFEKQNERCALTGRTIFFGKKNTDETTASLDRIDSKKGYFIDNIQWLHKDINRIKQIYTNEEFVGMCKEIAEYEKLK